MEKGKKNTQFGHFSVTCTVHLEHVPVHVRFWSFWANMYRVHIRGVPIHVMLCFQFRLVFVF